ncbi:MAG: paraquat-inducible protein A [Fibrobacterales bacterium]
MHWRRWTLLGLFTLFLGSIYADLIIADAIVEGTRVGYTLLAWPTLIKFMVIAVSCAITRIGLSNKVGLVLIMLSFAVLYPGLTETMLTIDMSTQVNASIPQFKQQVADFNATIMNKQRSIVGTVSDLYEYDKYLVATLILIFSAIIPIAKGFMLLIVLFSKNVRIERGLYNFVKTIGKWSMADVFVCAIFLGYLSMKDQAQQVMKEVSVMSMKMQVNIDLLSDAWVGPGFYYFLVYCIVSLAALHFIKISPRPQSVEVQK